MNAALFYPAHGFKGCIPGILEVLRRQVLLASNRCLNPYEILSPGQDEELMRLTRAYPDLVDDGFIVANRDRWLAWRSKPVHKPVMRIPNRIMLGCAVAIAGAHAAVGATTPQYQHGDILIPSASRDEPVRAEFSAALAENYLRLGAIAWKAERNCVSCHTTGTYMVIRPAMAVHLGPPLDGMREFFISELRQKQKMDRRELGKTKSVEPGQVIYIAAGLAEWDRHVTKRLSAEAAEALALMFEIQHDSGTWGTQDGWPPLESDAYHLATQAAMAMAAAPGWREGLRDEALLAAVQRLKTYLRETPPPHDYSRTLLLWATSRMADLLPAGRRQELVEVLWKHQRDDGGWSIRTFAAPEEWGRGNRAEKLRAEEEFADPPSDGHQTGLAIVVLREAGVPADDPRIQRGLRWIKANQRESGRWWTRSLNTDKRHFISYSGTAYPLLALSLCNELPVARAGIDLQ